MPPRLLLHICCAPCATYPLAVLQEKYAVVAYFYDPNIHPRSEYDLRLAEARKYFQNRAEMIEAKYDATRWFGLTQGLESEPERGKRCLVCYRMRLEQTAKYAALHGFDVFAAALTVSPHKDARAINLIGAKLAAEYGVKYLSTDWKKGGGYDQGVALSKTAGLVRQNYCGCVYSQRKVPPKITNERP